MKIAYIGHSHHQITKSSTFFTQFLEENAQEVIYFADETWRADDKFDVAPVMATKPDLIVVWQSERPAEAVAQALAALPAGEGPRMVFAPMFDGCQFLGEGYWAQFQDHSRCRVISFCAELHTRLSRWGVWSARAAYYTPLQGIEPIQFGGLLSGVFWQRRSAPSWLDVSKLIDGAAFNRLHIHFAPDPTFDAGPKPTPQDFPNLRLNVSEWFEKAEDFQKMLSGAQVFFCPRNAEGIGMAMLEAMALGQCVVAPDRPTMSEYITHGVSGLLYDPDAPQPLDFSNAAQIGANARRRALMGREDWEQDLQTRLKAVVFDDGLNLQDPAYQDFGLWRHAHSAQPQDGGGSKLREVISRSALSRVLRPARAAAPQKPRITVATVTYNAADVFPETFASIKAQDYEDVETLVVDGASSDGTVEQIKQRAAAGLIDRWVSAPDDGPYDAMNKAAALATGEFVIFMNAGDAFYAPQAISRAVAALKHTPDADFIIGHHYYIAKDDAQELHKAAHFDQTWSRLSSGELGFKWLSGVPGHQATFTKRSLLAGGGYDTSLRIAADHDFMYRMRAQGATFAHCDEILAIYTAGGLSSRAERLCVHEWWKIARKFSPQQEADAFFTKGFGPGAMMDPREVEALRAEIEQTGIFCVEWARQQSPADSRSNADPFADYLASDGAAPIDPHPFFDSTFYRANLSTTQRASHHGVLSSPLAHYLRTGQQEGRPIRDWDDQSDPLNELPKALGLDAPTPEQIEEALLSDEIGPEHALFQLWR